MSVQMRCLVVNDERLALSPKVHVVGLGILMAVSGIVHEFQLLRWLSTWMDCGKTWFNYFVVLYKLWSKSNKISSSSASWLTLSLCTK